MKINGIQINSFNKDKVEAAYPGAWMVEPQGIWQLPKNKQEKRQDICSSGEYFGQIKKDGFYYSFEIRDDRSYLFGRKKSVSTGMFLEKIENVPHIEKTMRRLFPNNTVILGEIYLPGGRSNDVTKIMNCKKDKAISRQKETGHLWFYIYDILSLDGISLLDKTNLERYKILAKYWTYHCVDNDNSFIEIAADYHYELDRWIDIMIANDEEGMVLKRSAGKFISGSKPAWETIKFKKEKYYDVLIIGTNGPTMVYTGSEIDTWGYWENIITKEKINIRPIDSDLQSYIPITKAYYYGWIGSINVGVLNQNGQILPFGSVSSGLSDELLKEISGNSKDYIYRPIMIRAMDIEDQAFRHGVFIDFRDDLNQSDCSYEKLKD